MNVESNWSDYFFFLQKFCKKKSSNYILVKYIFHMQVFFMKWIFKTSLFFLRKKRSLNKFLIVGTLIIDLNFCLYQVNKINSNSYRNKDNQDILIVCWNSQRYFLSAQFIFLGCWPLYAVNPSIITKMKKTVAVCACAAYFLYLSLHFVGRQQTYYSYLRNWVNIILILYKH